MNGLNFSLAIRRVNYLSCDFSKMIQRDYLVIGGGIVGASVCQGIRRYDTGERHARQRGDIPSLQALDSLEEFPA